MRTCRYEQRQEQKEASKKQRATKTEVKSIKMSAKTQKSDIHVRRADLCAVTCRFWCFNMVCMHMGLT